MNILNFLVDVANEHSSRANELKVVIKSNKHYYGRAYMGTLECKLFKKDINIHLFIASLINRFVNFWR